LGTRILKLNSYMSYKIKKLEEDFHNPYDEEEKARATKKKKNVSIADKGGLLKPRREIFNINRVVYTKRPNGEFTIMSKTQFAKGEIIEICPIIFVGEEAKGVDRLKDFIFEIEKPGTGKKTAGMFGLVLGYGSLYKHSETPNCEYAYNRANRQMYFKSAKVIQAHEELTINYGKDYWDERAAFNMVAPQNETPAAPVDEDIVTGGAAPLGGVSGGGSQGGAAAGGIGANYHAAATGVKPDPANTGIPMIGSQS